MAYERGLGSFSQALLNFLYLWKATFKTSIKVTTYLWSTVAKLQGLKTNSFYPFLQYKIWESYGFDLWES